MLYLMMAMQLNKDGFKDRNTLNRGCIALTTQLMRSETNKERVNNMYLKERIEEVIKNVLEIYIKEKVITVSDKDKDEFINSVMIELDNN